MSQANPNKTLGLMIALFCAALWGASFPLGGVLAGKLDPVVLAIARYAIATLGSCFRRNTPSRKYKIKRTLFY